MKKVLVTLIIIAVIGIVFWKWFFNQPCPPPEKPHSVPTTAIWKGGCDGGNWIELIEIDRDKIRFKIYSNWNGCL